MHTSLMLIEIQNFSFAKMYLKMSPFCSGGDELNSKSILKQLAIQISHIIHTTQFISRRIVQWRTAHYTDVIMGTIESQITSLTIVYSTVYSDADQRKYQSSALLAFVRGIHRRPVNSPHKWPVTRKMFLFDDVIMRIPQ